MGYTKELFLVPPAEDLICAVCLDVLEEPVMFNCPGDHLSCYECFDELRAHTTSPKCHSCRELIPTNQVRTALHTERVILSATVHCSRYELGCKWEGNLSDMPDHKNLYCFYKKQVCGYCSANFFKHNIEKHKTDCFDAPWTCPRGTSKCGELLKRNIAQHAKLCKYNKCSFHGIGCDFVGTKKSIEKHERDYCKPLQERIAELKGQNEESFKEMKSTEKAIKKLKRERDDLKLELKYSMDSHGPYNFRYDRYQTSVASPSTARSKSKTIAVKEEDKGDDVPAGDEEEEQLRRSKRSKKAVQPWG